MPAENRVFEATIDIKFRQSQSQIIGALAQMRDRAREVVEQFERIGSFDFSNLGLAGGGAGRDFGTVLRGLPNLGARGGVSGLSVGELKVLSRAFVDLADDAGMTIQQLGDEFDKFSDQISSASRIGADDIEQNIGGALRRAIEIFDEMGVEATGVIGRLGQMMAEERPFDPLIPQAENVKEELVGGSIIPDMVDEIGLHLARMGNFAEKSGDDLRNRLVSAINQARSEGTTSLEDMNHIFNRELIQAWKAGDVGGAAFSNLSDALRRVGDSGQISARKMIQFTQAIEAQQRSTDSFNRRMEEALQQTSGFRAGLDLVRGGAGLQGLRTAFFGTADTANVFGRTLDVVQRIQDRFANSTTREQKVLIKSVEALQKRSLAQRNALEDLKEFSARQGGAGKQISQVTFAMNRQVAAIIQQSQAAQANKKITEGGIATLRNSLNVLGQNIESIEEYVDQIEGGAEAYGPFLRQIKQFISQQRREVDLIESHNKAAQKSVKNREEETKSAKEQTNVFKRLLSVFGGFKRSQDEVAESSRNFSTSTSFLKTTMFQLVGAFTAADLAADVLRSTFQKISGTVRSFKDEFLGFGVIGQFTDDLTTGVVEFAAQIEQMRIGMRVVGEQAGYSIDFIDTKLQSLQEQGIATAGAINALVRGFAFGPEIVGGLEGTLQGLEDFRDALRGDEGLSSLLPEFESSIDSVADRLQSGTLTVDEMSKELIKLAATTQDPIEQMRIMKAASDAGALGLNALGLTAQNMNAAGFGQDTRTNLDNYTNSIQRMTTENAEASGVNTNASVIFERYADAIGTTSEALTVQQKRQALLIGIVQEGIPLLDVYGEVSDTAGKKISSMSRIIEDAKLALGDLFLPILNDAIDSFRAFAERITELARSDAAKQLAEVIRSLARRLNVINPIVRLFVDNFEAVIPVIKDVLTAINALLGSDFSAFEQSAVNAIARVAVAFESRVTAAINWGWNLIVNLANGVLEAANTILTQALEAVGNLFSAYFAPGSPPEQGPLSDMDEWGPGLMETIGNGMVSSASGVFSGAANAAAEGLISSFSGAFRDLDLANLRAVKDAFGNIRDVFQSLVSSGQLEETELVPGLVESRELLVQLANQFEDTGEISEEILEQIGSRLGEAGEDMKQFIRLQFQLRKAQEDLKQINEEIAVAEQAGFVPKELRDKQKAAQGQVDALSDQLTFQEELLSWQKESNDLVKQQVALLERIARQNEAAARAGAKGQQDQWQAFQDRYNQELAALETKKALGIISEEEYQRARLGLEQQYIDTAIKLNRELDPARIQNFLDLKEQVEALKGGKGKGLEGAAAAAEALNQALIDDANESAQGVESIRTPLRNVNEDFEAMRLKIKGIFQDIRRLFSAEGIAEALQKLRDAINIDIPIDIEELKTTIEEKLSGAFEFVRDNAAGILGGVGIAALIGPKLGGLGGLGTSLLAPLGKVFSPILNIITSLASTLLGPLLSALQAVGGAVVGILGPFGTIALVIGGVIIAFNLLGGDLDAIKEKFDAFKETIQQNTVFIVLQRIIGALVQAIGNFITNFVLAIQNLVSRLAEMESVRRFFDGLKTVLGVLAVIAGSVLTGALILLSGIINGLGEALVPLSDLIANVIDGFLTFVDFLITTVFGPIRILWTLFTEGPEEAAQAILDWVGRIRTLFTRLRIIGLRILGGFIDTIVSFFAGFIDTIVKIITKDSPNLSKAWRNIVQDIKTRVNQALKDARLIFEYFIGTAIPNAIRGVAQLVWDAISSVGGGILDTISGFGEALIDAGVGIVKNILEGIQREWENLQGWFSDKLSDLTDLLPWSSPPRDTSSPLSVLYDAGSGIIGNILEGMQKAKIDDDSIKGITDLVLGGTGSLVETLQEMILPAVENAREVISAHMEELGESMDDFSDDMQSMAREVELILENIARAFYDLRRRSVEAIISMTREITNRLRSLEGLIGVMYSIIGQMASAFYQLGPLISGVLSEVFGDVYTEGTVIYEIYNWALQAMEALAAGLSYGYNGLVLPVLQDIADAVENPDSAGPIYPPNSREDRRGTTGTDGGLSLPGFFRGEGLAAAFSGAGSITNNVTEERNFYIDNISFPGVTDAADAQDIWEQIELEVGRGRILGSLGVG